MPNSSPNASIARDRLVIARQVAGETLLVPARPGAADFSRIFLLNKVGAFLWQKLAQPRKKSELATLVRDEFAVAPEHDVDADIDKYLAMLTERGLVSITEEAA